MSTDDVVWRHSPDLASVESVDRVVVLHLNHGGRPARILEGSAAVTWMAVDGVRTESEVVEAVAAEYGLATEVVGEDVTRLLGDLEHDDLLDSKHRS